MHLIIGFCLIAAVLALFVYRLRSSDAPAACLSEFEREVAERDFDDLVLKTSHATPVLVDFYATWCAPCKLFTPILAEFARDYGGAFLLARVDVDRSKRLVEHYDIHSMPTVMLFREGKCVERFSGGKLPHTVRYFLAQNGIGK